MEKNVGLGAFPEAPDKLGLVAEIAEEAFWKEVAASCPEIKSGDVDPKDIFEFSRHCYYVVVSWYSRNSPPKGELFSVEMETSDLSNDFIKYLQDHQIRNEVLGEAFNGWLVRYTGTKRSLHVLLKAWWNSGDAEDLLDMYEKIKEANEVPRNKRKYVGWIYIEKSPGLKDHFTVHVTRDGRLPIVKKMGHGETGAASAVAFFEDAEVTLHDAPSGTDSKVLGLNLGPVKLEENPLGLRVFLPEAAE